ncbi:MAG TPA: DUF3299 domain-containing protein [Nitrosospira sp.]|nr:DUF3299 domain-containing protein [Nitrosospira sp.]
MAKFRSTVSFLPGFLPLFAFFWLASPVFSAGSSAPSGNRDYKVGDQLTPDPGKAKTKSTAPSASGSAAAYKEKNWDDLMPRNWDPMAPLKGLKLENLKDSDPRAMEALEKMREAWANAPVEPSLNGERIRIPGFVIPLEKSGNKVREFLLVPYFGACIHTPPPPPNQIIHVKTAKPVAGMRTMDTMWVSGVMQVRSVESEFGQAGYQLKAEQIDPYP